MVKTPPFSVGGGFDPGTKMPWCVAKIKIKRNPFSLWGLSMEGAANDAAIRSWHSPREPQNFLNTFTRQSLTMEPIRQLLAVHLLFKTFVDSSEYVGTNTETLEETESEQLQKQLG